MHYKSHPSGIVTNNLFAIKVEDLIREIIIQNEIPYYRIESGVEHHTAEGAEDGDMPVIRIITYFEDTVNKISHVLHDEFDVDIERSVDKKKIRIETFAYKNINYTARLKRDRQQQTEYKRSGNKKFEVQICSMLQDAWSGIEKELGYDTNFVPDEAKRDFYRVGALLEMADIEFLKIRTELGQKLINKKNAAATAETVQPAAEKEATTFADFLNAVSKEAPSIQQPVVTFSPPVSEAPKVVAPEPEVQIPEPAAPVMQVPVVPEIKVEAAPQPVAQIPVIETTPVQQIKVEVAPPPPPAPVPQAQEVTAVLAKSVKFEVIPPANYYQPIAEIPAMPAAIKMDEPVIVPVPQQPKAAAPALGIAPKAINVPSVESVVNATASGINLGGLKELAESINHTEIKNNITVPVPPAPKAEIIIESVIPPTPIPEAPKAAVMPELVVPVAERIITESLPQITALPDISNSNVNGSGIFQKIPDIIREEKAAPVVNEEAKATKAVQVDENAQMTDASLRDYVMNSKILKEIDLMIAERAGAKINTDIDIEGDVDRLRFLKVYSLKQLHDRLTDNKMDIVAFAEKWIGKDNGGSFDSGISLFYLEYLLVGKKNDPAFAVDYVVKFISDNDYSARYIIPTYNSIHNTEAPNFSHLTLKA
jgi:Region found in RelA / SpoT proteins